METTNCETFSYHMYECISSVAHNKLYVLKLLLKMHIKVEYIKLNLIIPNTNWIYMEFFYYREQCFIIKNIYILMFYYNLSSSPHIVV